MSQGQPIRSLAALGGAWKARVLADCQHPRGALVTKGSDTRCGVCGRALTWFEVADLPYGRSDRQQDHPTVPSGDLAPCPCGKRSYPSEADAVSQAAAFGGGSRPYVCPLGLPVWHLQRKGASRRQRTGAA